MEQLTPDERISAQEKALEAVNCELALLRQHMDERFTGMRERTDAQFANTRERTDAQFTSMRELTDAQFASMRQYVDAGFAKYQLQAQLNTKEEVSKAVELLSGRIDGLQGRMESQGRWIFGLLVTILASLVALAARGLVA